FGSDLSGEIWNLCVAMDDILCSDMQICVFNLDSTLGVFHYRSASGQYKLNYTAAQQSCRAEGGTLATYTQLSYGGLNMCSAGWLDQGRVAYPTTYPNSKCGFGHVGIPQQQTLPVPLLQGESDKLIY
uniref:Link domain-containing protein n=1 Tax=Cyprinodon variegatus TaxID=28743 RepID=A0A3Q2CNB4_CYPVA